MTPELHFEEIDAMGILRDNVATLQRVRDVCLNELIDEQGKLSDKARPVLLAALDDLRKHAETAVKLWGHLYNAEQIRYFQDVLIASVDSAAPDVGARIREALKERLAAPGVTLKPGQV